MNARRRFFAEEVLTRFTSPVQIFDCAGARDPSLQPILKTALFAGKWRDVRRLRRDDHGPEPTCIIHRPGTCLSA